MDLSRFIFLSNACPLTSRGGDGEEQERYAEHVRGTFARDAIDEQSVEISDRIKFNYILDPEDDVTVHCCECNTRIHGPVCRHPSGLDAHYGCAAIAYRHTTLQRKQIP